MTVVMAQSIKSISIGLSGHAREGRKVVRLIINKTHLSLKAYFSLKKAD